MADKTYSSHHLTKFFNTAFKEFITTHLRTIKADAKIVKNIPHKPQYHAAQKLADIRNEFSKKELSKKDIDKLVEQINALVSRYRSVEPELEYTALIFFQHLNEEFKTDYKIIIKKPETEKPKEAAKSSPVSVPKPVLEPTSLSHPSIPTGAIKKNLIIFFSSLIILSIIVFYLFNATTTQTVSEEVPVINESFNEILSDKISLQQYFDDIHSYEGESVKLKGMLTRYVKGEAGVGQVVEGIADDYDNVIEIKDLKSRFRNLFPNRGVSEGVYEIEGVFERNYQTLLLRVSSIEPAERDVIGTYQKAGTITTMQLVEKNITVYKFPAVRDTILGFLG